MAKVALGEIVLDFAIYPRSQVSTTHTSHMIQAYEAGTQFPPVRLDRASKRTVDGFHRVRMYQHVCEPTDKVDVEFRDYENEGELVRDAIRLNATHGRPLSPFDRARSVSLAEAYGVTVDEVAADLGITTVSLQRLSDTVRAYGPKDKPITLKRGVASYMRGKTLTAAQVAANEKLDGMSPLYHVNQLVRLIENGMVEMSEPFVARLRHLCSLIKEEE